MKELKKGLISVIVPCYNVERFLPDCFASLVAQTNKNFEAIFVNDGSTDDSERLLEDFCADKPNFHVQTKENGGVSTARNLGLKHAVGEFVYFVDPDDFFDPRTLEIASDVLKNSDADVCIFKNRWLKDGKKNALFPHSKNLRA